MSGLLVKSTLIMKENLEVMNERGITIPVILGGAALTRRYVEQDLRSVYRGRGVLCQRRLRRAAVHGGDRAGDARVRLRVQPGQMRMEALTGTEAKIALAEQEDARYAGASGGNGAPRARSAVRTDVPIPSPPFLGSACDRRHSARRRLRRLSTKSRSSADNGRCRKGKQTEEQYRALLRGEGLSRAAPAQSRT